MNRWEKIAGNPLVVLGLVAAVGLGFAAFVDFDPVEERAEVQSAMAGPGPVDSARVKEVFSTAVKLQLDERKAYLARVLADPTLEAADARRIRNADFLMRIDGAGYFPYSVAHRPQPGY